MRAILDEQVDTADMVALVKEWHKKVGVCEDIQSCGCCGVRDFQQVKEVEVSKLLNKALADVKKHELDVCTRWTLLGHVQSGQVGFPLLLNKELARVKKHGLDVCTR